MNFQIFKTNCGRIEKIFVSILGLSLAILTLKVFLLHPITLLSVFMYLLLVLLFCTLGFLAYFDFKNTQVHNILSFVLMIALVGVNISLFFLFKNSLDIKLIGDWIYNPYYNMMGALILGSIFQLIVLVSKEKALGQGDVRIAIISGLLVGSINLTYWGYITVFSALAYGLIVAYKKKKFKGLRIPFVPFMVLGNVIIILINL